MSYHGEYLSCIVTKTQVRRSQASRLTTLTKTKGNEGSSGTSTFSSVRRTTSSADKQLRNSINQRSWQVPVSYRNQDSGEVELEPVCSSKADTSWQQWCRRRRMKGAGRRPSVPFVEQHQAQTSNCETSSISDRGQFLSRIVTKTLVKLNQANLRQEPSPLLLVLLLISTLFISHSSFLIPAHWSRSYPSVTVSCRHFDGAIPPLLCFAEGCEIE